MGEGQRYRQGQERQGHRLPWLQGKDREWHDQGQPRQEQGGKIGSKKASARGKKNFANSALKAWCDATKAARKALNLKGFVPVGGKTAQGKALYAKAKSLLK